MPAQGEPRAHAARRTQRPQLAQSAVIRKRILDIAESLAQIQEKYVRSNLIRCRFFADIVAKVFFGRSTKILTTADAFRVCRHEGTHRFKPKRRPTSY